ncbi:GGDEF domain-containing protein [Acinetobacter sp. Ver3]|uniref:GGDEF domain-containing protein n=1 Tax=Acinetobacter sp. Ver3 TaxID=466088 RepID=UPI000445048E|nr:GGDEF domain-containing protein [Acinetobacter sp. Ver3]EZQ11285.1 diguanylate cyclase [Acinetobacter sp. Ver3]
MLKSHSEQIGRRLFVFVIIIVLSILCISIPLVISHYREYQKSQTALIEIENLRAVAALANRISRERGPANMAMSSSQEEFEKNKQALIEYRAGVDEQIKVSIHRLDQSGYDGLEEYVAQYLNPKLAEGRKQVDHYISLPFAERTPEALDQAILTMFNAWDSSHDLLKKLVMQSKSKDSSMGHYYTMILVLADLRDQAGRVASNVTAHVTFQQPLPSDNIARALQTQKQVRYLWDLVNTIQPERHRTAEFARLHQEVKTQFIDQGLPIIMRLIDESRKGQPYFLSGTELSVAVSGKFLTVIDLQDYLLNKSVEIAKSEKDANQLNFILTLIVSLISLLAALFTMIYVQRKVISPLIMVRDKLVELSYANALVDSHFIEDQQKQVHSLHEAMQKLQKMLHQRDEFEFELKNIANTDKLTGVSNRFALEAYTKLMEAQPNKFTQTCLMIVDIDYFKQVNDQYGHVAGDQVIQQVANCLSHNVRSTDLVVRFGGDEFLVLIENLDLEHGLRAAEKMRKGIGDLQFTDEQGQSFTVSISVGVTVGADSWKALFAKADQALFRAKAQGRNTVSS